MAGLRGAVNMDGGKACDNCQRNPAEVFCVCTQARIYLCGGCIANHTTVKYRSLTHQLVSIDAEVPNIRSYKERSDALVAGSAELEQNLTRIDQCCQEIASEYDAAIEQLKRYRDYYVNELQNWKVALSAEITEAKNEVMNTLELDEVQLRCKYSPLLRQYRPGTLQLFSYEIDTSGIQTWAANLVKFKYEPALQGESSAPPESRELFIRLTADHIEYFNFQSETFAAAASFSKPVAIDPFTSFTLVDENSMFLCGNRSGSKATYLLRVTSGAVEDLPPLGVARSNAGLLSRNHSVFVFGSLSEFYAGGFAGGKEVEMLQLGSREWTRLPDMSIGRCCFTPCAHDTTVYLCTAEATIDVFSLQTLSFLAPIQKRAESFAGAVSAVVGDELVIITCECTTVIDLRSHTERRQEHEFGNIPPASTPVVFQQGIYWVSSDGKCWKASGTDFSAVKEVEAGR